MIVYTTEKFFIEQKKNLFILIAYVFQKYPENFKFQQHLIFDVIYP